MRLVKTSEDVFVLQCTFDERLVAKEAGMIWNKFAPKCWATKSKNVAAKLARFASPELRVELEGKKKLQEDALVESRAESSDAVIPCPEGMDYLPFQKAGIAYAMKRLVAL